ncbi:MAG TPA: class I SAM-dependent methyltransferase [Polyangia bacterium]|nr:class I SAM-dependent methyltransferase [Polyangia bacterium]
MRERRDNQAYYDEFAAGYEKRRHHGYHALIDRLEIAATLPYASGARVLEAGCGTGLILKEVAPLARRAVGVDVSPGMLRKAHARGLDVVHGSVTDLPFGDEEFDLAYSFKVLAHVERIERAMGEMARVVRRGGHVIAEFYNPWSLRGLIKRLKPPTRISTATTDEAVYTRYDSLPAIRKLMPHDLHIIDVRGVRVFTPFSAVHDVPLVGHAFAAAETRAASAPLLRHLGGFMVVTAERR